MMSRYVVNPNGRAALPPRIAALSSSESVVVAKTWSSGRSKPSACGHVISSRPVTDPERRRRAQKRNVDDSTPLSTGKRVVTTPGRAIARKRLGERSCRIDTGRIPVAGVIQALTTITWRSWMAELSHMILIDAWPRDIFTLPWRGSAIVNDEDRANRTTACLAWHLECREFRPPPAPAQFP
jgi:hypothetical protein